MGGEAVGGLLNLDVVDDDGSWGWRMEGGSKSGRQR